MRDVFEFSSYTDYLASVLRQEHPKIKRSDLCNFLHCQPSFLSQVLTGKSHLTLEHAFLVSQFLKRRRDEKRFFLLLVQKARAGSDALKSHFDEELKTELTRRQPIKDRLGVQDELTLEDQAVYYSQWWYGAIHILVAFPEFNNADAIAARLGLNAAVVKKALQFLVARGLITSGRDGLKIGKKRIHLGSQSPLINRHHMNWRAKCLSVLEKDSEDDVHFSGVIGVSRAGARKIREAILSLLKTSEGVVRDTKEEAPFVMLVDFFEL